MWKRMLQLALAASCALPMIQSMRLSGLALTSAKRVEALAALPTVAKSALREPTPAGSSPDG